MDVARKNPLHPKRIDHVKQLTAPWLRNVIVMTKARLIVGIQVKGHVNEQKRATALVPLQIEFEPCHLRLGFRQRRIDQLAIDDNEMARPSIKAVPRRAKEFVVLVEPIALNR